MVDGALLSATKTIYAIGRNYAEHAAELGNAIPERPIVFLKSSSSIRGPEPSPMGFSGESYHHEIELVLRIGRLLKMGSSASQQDISHIALGLDLTRRDEQNLLKQKGLPWTIAKSFKGAAVLGPLQSFAGVDLDKVDLSLSVNGETRQQGNTSMMIHSVAKLLDYLLSFNDLEAGDLIFTGTPKGVNTIKVGDEFSMSSEALGYSCRGRI